MGNEFCLLGNFSSDRHKVILFRSVFCVGMTEPVQWTHTILTVYLFIHSFTSGHCESATEIKYRDQRSSIFALVRDICQWGAHVNQLITTTYVLDDVWRCVARDSWVGAVLIQWTGDRAIFTSEMDDHGDIWDWLLASASTYWYRHI